MKIYIQDNFMAEKSNMDVTLAYLEYVTPGLRQIWMPNLNTGKKGPTL